MGDTKSGTKVQPSLSKKDDKNKKDEKTKKEELTEEDERLKEDLEQIVRTLDGNDQSLYKNALEILRTLIRTSTTSMTSVPKPLKYMRNHYLKMLEIHEKIKDTSVQKFCADIVSVLAMTSAIEGSRDCLHYRLRGGQEAVLSWGLEYIRHLTSEIADEWNQLEKSDPGYQEKCSPLLSIVEEIVPYYMQHNAESEACDLLMEIERLDLLIKYTDAESQQRVCLYMMSCIPFVPDDENQKMLETVKAIHLKYNKRIEALRCAIMMNKIDDVKKIFLETKELVVQKQMAFILGRHQIFLELDSNVPFESELNELMSNSKISENFLALARELEITEAKTPEDVYKTQFEPSRGFGSQGLETGLQNIASSFTNGFVNVGFCNDKLLGNEANKWFFKNKESGMMAAAASLGLIYRWDMDSGLNAIDKYLYVPEDHIKAGALLAVGIINNGIHHEADPAAALLSEFVKSDKPIFQIGSILGLGLAYANSKRQSVQETVVPMLLQVLRERKATKEVMGVTALALGLIHVGTANGPVSTAIYELLCEKTELELKDFSCRLMALGFALTYLGKQNEADIAVEIMQTIKEPFGKMASTLVEISAYAGTGNVLKIQKLLHICSEHYETVKSSDKTKTDKEKDKESKIDLSSQQSVAVLGIALIAMGEDIGSSMSFRLCGNLLRYGDVAVKRAVPLALGLISVSNPQLNIIETLSKFSHDSDPETACASIFALGLVGAGTNNARLAALLRQLAVYHQRESLNLMLVRIAQGMIHMGKGTMTLNPFHSDRQLLNPAALAGLFTVCFTMLDSKPILTNQSYMLYTMIPAIQPRVLITFEAQDTKDCALKPVNVSVRVGQAVDVVGQAGKPKTITGFQTSSTPVLLAYGERAELAVDDYTSISPSLEGFVILRKTPEASKS
uniref:26S proteasome non-ATPase regulatory subunit 2 n=1 Tax=Romanomermis culicivorax TaxID=13658 RepID=A0A915J7H7_ROMCU